MLATSPRELTPGTAAVALGPAFDRMIVQRFGVGADRVVDEASLTFLADLSHHVDVPLREGTLAGPQGNSFGTMARAVLAELVGDAPVQLVVLAHAGPDLTPNEMAGPTCAGLLAGAPVAMAVTDQGSAGVFTAVRIAQLWLRRPGVETAVVLACDQRMHPFDLGLGGHLAIEADVAVGLLLRRGSGAVVRQSTVPAHQLIERLDDVCREVPGDSGVAVLGPGLSTTPWSRPGWHAVRSPAGQPATAVWSAWAGVDDTRTGATVVIDHDPAVGVLSVLRSDGRVARR